MPPADTPYLGGSYQKAKDAAEHTAANQPSRKEAAWTKAGAHSFSKYSSTDRQWGLAHRTDRPPGDTVSALNESQFAAALKSDAAAATFSLAKAQANKFVQMSTVLIAVLDTVAAIHPGIEGQQTTATFLARTQSNKPRLASVATIAFKAAVELEKTRRENNDKVTALNMTMFDMLSVLEL